MPALSPTMEEGKLAKWHVKIGDKVKSGDIIAEIETDKATMEVEAVDEGVVADLLVAEGTEGVKVNAVIAQLRDEGEKYVAGAKAAPPPPSTTPPARSPSPASGGGPQITKASSVAPPPRAADGGLPAEALAKAGGGKSPAVAARLFASPLARRIAAQGGVELTVIQGSGPHGRIVKADVEAAAKGGVARAPAAAPKPTPVAPRPAEAPPPSSIPDARLYFAKDAYDEVPHDSMRKTIAKRLTAAKRDIPHFYLKIDCTIDTLLDVRKQMNEKAPTEGAASYKLSVNDFIVKAAALALIRVPGVNSSWTDTALLRHKHADIGVAVALEFGLITPIVFAAETKSLAAISREVKDLAGRAKTKKLKPAEFEGGSFAISNLGMFGIKDFTAVINPPHAAILAVGAGEQRAVVKKGALAIANVMTVQLSCDHRVIDGSLGATWLEAFKGYIEDPVTMLV
ncbi:MAG: pyruvate dehydrogenase complex dihydrolipoamide acetyltransferase [Alphaproteobacteria bacterium]|nr:pyruvate dehydrogenase complex dihydrolipoamide acetyltransferase [Alphaproteobacteria bacterium]